MTGGYRFVLDVLKLDGVGPVDNIPSTDKFPKRRRKKIKINVTRDT